jgi:hypothetical protein
MWLRCTLYLAVRKPNRHPTVRPDGELWDKRSRLKMMDSIERILLLGNRILIPTEANIRLLENLSDL